MTQVSDWDVDNAGGSAVRAQLNGIIAAQRSCSSGPAAPSPTVAGMLWFDTTNLVLKVRNNANTAWVTASPETVGANTFWGNPTGSAAALQAMSIAQANGLLGWVQSIAGTGYQKLPSGLILQWFTSAAIGSGVNTLTTLPLTFPTAHLAAFASYVNTGSNANVADGYIGQVRALTTSSVTIRNLGPFAATFFCLCIGV